MRILGFSKKWTKLQNKEFTTFRFPRRDADWAIGEVVQIVYKPRSKERETLGLAEIMDKELRNMTSYWGEEGIQLVTNNEVIRDGFTNWEEMFDWLSKAYGLPRLATEPMNKLTLRWL